MKRFAQVASFRGNDCSENQVNSCKKPVLPWWAAGVCAFAGGIVLDAGFPDKNLWPLTFVGIALALLSIIGRGYARAFLFGLIFGASFWSVHISWLTLYLGPVPWLGLTSVMAIFFACGSSAIAVVYRHAHHAWPTLFGRLGILPLVVAGLWTAREAITAVAPEGGFSWGRVAFSQSSSPFAFLSSYLGISGLSFVLVWLTAFFIQLVREKQQPLLNKATLVVAAFLLLFALPPWPVSTFGTVRVAAVQGNSKSGLFDRVQRGDNLRDHRAASSEIAPGSVDVIVWPENSSDLDPQVSSRAAQELDELTETLGAPVIVGTITERGGEIYNSSLLWENGAGVTDYYDKRHPVPFAEYMPARAFFRLLAPDLVDLVTRDYARGNTDTVFDVAGVRLGASICFDITDDSVSRLMVNQGASVLLAQTNNADFGRTDENLQQLAIARLRAFETGRSVVNISTVGHSAIFAPDGSILESIPAYQPGVMVANVPLSTAMTPAVLFGSDVELFISVFGIFGLVFVLIHRRKAPLSTRQSFAGRDGPAGR